MQGTESSRHSAVDRILQTLCVGPNAPDTMPWTESSRLYAVLCLKTMKMVFMTHFLTAKVGTPFQVCFHKITIFIGFKPSTAFNLDDSVNGRVSGGFGPAQSVWRIGSTAKCLEDSVRCKVSGGFGPLSSHNTSSRAFET